MTGDAITMRATFSPRLSAVEICSGSRYRMPARSSVRVASYPALKSALAHIEAHRSQEAPGFDDEGTLVIATLATFLRKRAEGEPLTIDLTAPENQGGSWLNAIRIAREKLRLAPEGGAEGEEADEVDPAGPRITDGRAACTWARRRCQDA